MKFGVISCVIGILAIILEMYFFFFAGLLPNNVIVGYIIIMFGGIISLTIFLLILSIIAVILGGFGLTKDPSTEFAKAGIVLGIVGIIVGASIIMTELGIFFPGGPSIWDYLFG